PTRRSSDLRTAHGGELAEQDLHGRAVGGDVVDGDGEHVVLVVEPDQHRADGDLRGEVEVVRGPAVDDRAGRLLALAGGQDRDVLGRQGEASGVRGHGDGALVGALVAGAQDRVPFDDAPQGQVEGGRVDGPA